jgi:hypothetical protein
MLPPRQVEMNNKCSLHTTFNNGPKIGRMVGWAAVTTSKQAGMKLSQTAFNRKNVCNASFLAELLHASGTVKTT